MKKVNGIHEVSGSIRLAPPPENSSKINEFISACAAGRAAYSHGVAGYSQHLDVIHRNRSVVPS
jgi:hypothetical protein